MTALWAVFRMPKLPASARLFDFLSCLKAYISAAPCSSTNILGVTRSIFRETISVITNDGRNIVGVLKGFNQATNIILDESHERVYSTKEGVQQLVLGLYRIRGDNISIVGELDEEMDAHLDLSGLRAHPLKPVIH
ncbi:PREDICTED: U6 snRNA-associated Sm-like protein LSm8 [Populus euphratica]|uniref:U6 snRNA-associated Sm-like protein LSm8 n=1 Tax=Populus euphratica TaxID=75702 RepID=A0AAJ6X489_POPEU|nr:PREDICTED: U6 snRNA-associated Sm-like protein LSm8 [Populus euphratica]